MTSQTPIVQVAPGAELAPAGPPLTMRDLAAAAEAQHARTNTRDAYRGDWNLWLQFCEAAQADGLDVLPLDPNPDHLIVFAKWLAEGHPLADGTPRRASAPESVRRRLTGVMAGWTARDVTYPARVSTRARQWVKGHEAELVARNEYRGRGKAPAARAKHLRRIVAACPDTLAGHRDRALVLLGFAIAARRSELAFLDVSDIAAQDEGLLVHVRRSKSGARHSPVIRGQNRDTCPVTAWERWLTESGISDGAAFRRVDRHGRLLGRLSGEACGNIVARAARRAGVPDPLTGHSLRSGLATEARRAGHSVEQIADQGGWSRTSSALHGYIRSVDQWGDNVLAGIGL